MKEKITKEVAEMVRAEAEAVGESADAYIKAVSALKDHRATRKAAETDFENAAKTFGSVRAENAPVVEKFIQAEKENEEAKLAHYRASDERKKAERKLEQWESMKKANHWKGDAGRPPEPDTIEVPEMPEDVDADIIADGLISACAIAEAAGVFSSSVDWCEKENELVEAVTAARSKFFQAFGIYKNALEKAIAKNEERIKIENARREKAIEDAKRKKDEAEKELAELGAKC